MPRRLTGKRALVDPLTTAATHQSTDVDTVQQPTEGPFATKAGFSSQYVVGTPP